MKLIDIWKSNQKPTLSFELFPSRSSKSAEKLEKTIDQLAVLKPDFVSVTFGAGGSTREGSYQLVQNLKNRNGLEILPYFAGYGLGPEEIKDVLNSYQNLGVDNLLIVRGDSPEEQNGFSPHPQSLTHASALMDFVRPLYNLCLGVAGYPEGHRKAESIEKDIEYLKLKVDKGAEFVITNYCYDNRYFFEFVESCRRVGIEVPILPGVMPIYSVKRMEAVASICGTSIPKELYQKIAILPEGDKEAVIDFGIKFAIDQCRELLSAGLPGIHIYTMNRTSPTAEIVNQLRDEGLL